MKSLFESNMNLLGRVMDLRMERQNVVMGNLANIATPNYKARSLEWEEQLQAALNRDAKGKLSITAKRHMPSKFDAKTFAGEGETELRPHLVHGDDSVSLDKEMATMSKNQMMYNALATILKGNFEGIKTAIMEGAK